MSVRVGQIVSLLEPLPGRRVLDLGCGTAALAVELAARGYDVTGLDWVIEPARRRVAACGAKVRLIEQNMAAMSFDAEFDAVVNWDISGVGMLPADEENIDLLRRIARAVAPGGKVLVETYHPAYVRNHPGKVEGLVFNDATGRCEMTVARPSPNGASRTWQVSIRCFEPAQWRDLLHEVGLDLLGLWSGFSREPLTDAAATLVVLASRP
ncbi:MAG: class I SAM-dependent methyltransferase [Planctomycetes bacterium]|nr:class I SAM-dependent methyltransferase [Planctomycetota bacterium]